MADMEKLIAWLDGERGRRTELAKELRIAPASLSGWKRVPSKRLFAVSKFTGIPVEDLLEPEPAE